MWSTLRLVQADEIDVAAVQEISLGQEEAQAFQNFAFRNGFGVYYQLSERSGPSAGLLVNKKLRSSLIRRWNEHDCQAAAVAGLILLSCYGAVSGGMPPNPFKRFGPFSVMTWLGSPGSILRIGTVNLALVTCNMIMRHVLMIKVKLYRLDLMVVGSLVSRMYFNVRLIFVSMTAKLAIAKPFVVPSTLLTTCLSVLVFCRQKEK